MTGGKSWEDALAENRSVHSMARERQHLSAISKLQRLQIEAQNRRRLKAELDSICLSFSALSPDELVAYRVEMASKVKRRISYFGGGIGIGRL